MNYGNIVIAVQYRLGPFGFLHYYDEIADSVIGGNYGLNDVFLALKFTSENAGRIGGDPSKIVINGESAGGGIVMALLLHQPSVDLISGAIAQSGATLLNFLGTQSETKPMAKLAMNEVILRLCSQFTTDEVKCDNTTTTENQFKQLKLVDAQKLMITSANFGLELGPVPLDGIFYTEDALKKYMANNLITGYKVL